MTTAPPLPPTAGCGSATTETTASRTTTMPEYRDHGHPQRKSPVPLHHVQDGPVVLKPVAEDGQQHARRVVCGYAVGDTDEQQVADARELLDALGLGVG